MTKHRQAVEFADRCFRECAVRADTYNETDNTVEVIWSTGADVVRRDYDSRYVERLSMKPEHMRLERMKSGAMSVLDSHDNWSLANRIGIIQADSIRFKKDRAYCRVKISQANQLGKQLLEDLRSGMPFAVSVGYKIHGYEQSDPKPDNELPIRLVTDWEPLEISAVTVPADGEAVSRTEKNEDEVLSTSTKKRPKAKRLSDEDRARIEDVGRRFQVPENEILSAIARNMPIDEFREIAIERRAQQDDADACHSRIEAPGLNEPATRIAAMEDALFARVNPGHKPADSSRQFVGYTMVELARAVLEGNGSSTAGESRSQIIGRALHSSSDFPIILGNVLHRQLATAYAQKPAALKRIARATTARDFRDKRSIKLSAGPDLQKVNEAGEYKRGTFTEGEEKYRIATFGRVFGITRQAIINDDLGAFERVPVELGRKAAALEAEELTKLLVSNPVMGDGNPLFHASHNNIGAGVALSIDALAGARLVMRKQKGLAGELIEVAPRYLIVPAELETTAEKILAEITAAKSDDVNPFSNKLELVVEPRFENPTAWYLAADPAEIDGLEYAHLEGEPGPQFAQRAGFDVDGLEIKVRLDFGCGVMDWRGLYLNPGA